MVIQKKICFIGLFFCAVSLACAGCVYWLFFKRPLVSVVMPTYNRADMLPRAIDSILAQTFKDFEFVIVDDGSTDNTVSLIQSYQKKDKRIRLLINSKNRGIAYSRNRGMDAARGKYLAIMDSDDYSVPERLEKSLLFFKKHPDYTVVNSVYYEMGRENKGLNNWVPPKRWEIIFNFANYYTNLAMFKLDFVRKHNIKYNENLISAEDYDFWSKIWLAGGKLGMINEPLIYLRRHNTHTKEYYENIKNTRAVVSTRLLKRFNISKEDAAKDSKCYLMNLMMQGNQDKIVDEYVLRLTIERQCGGHIAPNGTLYVKHFDFVDDFYPLKNNVYQRAQNGKIYRLIKRDMTGVIFETQEGVREKYRIQNDGSYALIEDLTK